MSSSSICPTFYTETEISSLLDELYEAEFEEEDTEVEYRSLPVNAVRYVHLYLRLIIRPLLDSLNGEPEFYS